MRPQQLMAAFGIFAIGTMLACISSGRWLLDGETNIFVAAASFNTVQGAPTTILTYWNAIVTMLSWDYPFLSSGWVFPIKFFLWIISIGVVWGLIEFGITIIQGVVGAVRSIITP